MRTYIFSMTLLVGIIALLIFNFFNVETKSHEINNSLNKLEQSLTKKDEQDIEKNLKKALSLWEDKKEMLLIFANHKDLDQISQTFTKIKIRVEQKRYKDAIEEIHLAKFFLEDITNNELPTISNIF